MWPDSEDCLPLSEIGSQDYSLCVSCFFNKFFSSREPRKLLMGIIQIPEMPIISIFLSKPQICVECSLYAIHLIAGCTSYEKRHVLPIWSLYYHGDDGIF